MTYERSPGKKMPGQKTPDKRALDGRLLDKRTPDKRTPDERKKDERIPNRRTTENCFDGTHPYWLELGHGAFSVHNYLINAFIYTYCLC